MGKQNVHCASKFNARSGKQNYMRKLVSNNSLQRIKQEMMDRIKHGAIS